MSDEWERRLDRLQVRLAGPLPGPAILRRLLPENREIKSLEAARAEGCREGGVLLLLYPIERRPHIVLTVRSATLRTHAGQISLPGGRVEPGESIVTAALREAWEELGVRPEAVTVLGRLSSFFIPPSNFCLNPVVGAIPSRPDFEPHTAEVAELIESPVDHFTDPANLRQEQWQFGGESRRVGYYQVGPHKVWGATAMVLAEFVELWNGSGP